MKRNMKRRMSNSLNEINGRYEPKRECWPVFGGGDIAFDIERSIPEEESCSDDDYDDDEDFYEDDE